MKHLHLFGSLLLVATMTACSENELLDGAQNPNNAIQFSVSADKQARGTVVDNFNIKDNGNVMGLYAYDTGADTWATFANILTEPNLMNDQDVTSDGTNWTYSPLRYWSGTPGDKISFFAYFPKDAAYTSASAVSGSLPAIIFTQSNTPADMKDLIVAHKLDVTKQPSVALPFQHVLSRVNFTGKMSTALGDDNTQIFVKSVKVLATDKLYSKATYKLGKDIENSEWDYTSTETFTSGLDAQGILDVASNTLGTYTSESVAIPTDASEKGLFKAGEYLFLIPPGGKTGTAATDDIKFEVEYDIVTNATPTLPVESKKETITLATGNLQEGKAYNVELIFDLTAIQVSTTLAAWTEATTTLDYTTRVGDDGAVTYTVYTGKGLMDVAALVNASTNSRKSNITLADDITFNNEAWTPIGNNNSGALNYNGVFDGQGHTITGLTIKDDITYEGQGLVGALGSSGVIQNVHLVNCSISAAKDKTGGIAGINFGYVSNCSVSGISTLTSRAKEIGAIAGRNDSGTIENCFIKDNISITGNANVGGIVGQNGAKVVNCEVNSTIKSNIRIYSASGTGGIAGGIGNGGEITGCTVSNNAAEATIKIISNSHIAGGIVSSGSNSIVSNCNVYGCSLSSETGKTVGGIIGNNNDNNIVSACTVDNCTLSATQWVGGIAGKNAGENSVVVACYTQNLTMTITNNDNTVGGIAGVNAGSNPGQTIACYNFGSLSVVGTNFEKGRTNPASSFYGSINDCYYSNAAGGLVTSVNATASDVRIDDALLTDNSIKDDNIAWSDAVKAMNLAIDKWNIANGNACKYKWDTTTDYDAAELVEI